MDCREAIAFRKGELSLSEPGATVRVVIPRDVRAGELSPALRELGEEVGDDAVGKQAHALA